MSDRSPRISYFNISISDLQNIMNNGGQQGLEIVKSYGGQEGIALLLRTSTIYGISTVNADIDYRVAKFGSNIIPAPKGKSLIKLMCDAFTDPTLIILMCAAILSLVLANISKEGRDNYDWIEGVAILFAVFVVVFVTSFNDYTKELQFRGLQKKLDQEHDSSVVRDGIIMQIRSDSIVTGDVCVLNYGDMIPADGILVHGIDLRVDESSMTGETEHVKKNLDRDVTLYAGTKVMDGNGKMLALTVGIYTKYGIILTLLSDSEKKKEKSKKKERKSSVKSSIFIAKSKDTVNSEQKSKDALNVEQKTKEDDTIENQASRRSVLQTKLLKLAIKIGYAGSAVAILTIVVLILRLLISKFVIKHEPWKKENYNDLVKYLIIGVSVLVVAVPEGLPLAVTISLAYSVKKMMKDHNLVRHLDACETMGNATTICSDKTGTLTTNRMTVVQFYMCERLYFKMPTLNWLPDEVGELFVVGASVNSSYKSKLVPGTDLTRLDQIGNKTECALLGLVLELGASYEEIRSIYTTENLVYIYSFNSARKSMSTVIKLDNGFRVFTKGAPEIIIPMCSTTYDINGAIEELTGDMKERLYKKVIYIMSRQGLRTLAMAHRDFPIEPEPNWVDEETIQIDLTFTCCVGIEDPLRPEVPKAIAMCQKAGIVVRMVTGDNIDTAISIASKCGIITPYDKAIVLDSQQFNTLIRRDDGTIDQALFDKIWPHLLVLARSSPQDKYILVKHIIASRRYNQRQIVAVTGDGTNDGPALKEADVGFAMGIAGTDVAKEACDIIITDDNFYSIVKAVMWGRNVYDSISKFLQFQLTVNIVAVTAAFVGACITEITPLKAIQLLWVNIIMDTLASLALATELPSETILNRKPYGRAQSIISKKMLKNIFGQSIYQLSIIFFLIFWKSDLISPPINYDKEKELSARLTIVFNSLVIMTLFNEINCRKINGELNVFGGILKNKIFLIVWISSFVAQIFIVQFGGLVFATKPLTGFQWLWCLLFGVLVLVWGFILNIVHFRKKDDDSHLFNDASSTSAMGVIDNSSRQTILTLKLSSGLRFSSLWLRSTARVRTQLRVIKAFSRK